MKMPVVDSLVGSLKGKSYDKKVEKTPSLKLVMKNFINIY